MPNQITSIQNFNAGSQQMAIANITFNGSYDATLKEQVSAADLGLGFINSMFFPAEGMPEYIFRTQTASDKKSVAISIYQVEIPAGVTTLSAYSDTAFSNSPEPELAMYYTGLTGTFQVAETVTGGTSGASGTVDTVDTDTNGNARLLLTGISGTFSVAETLTGGTSGATATSVDAGHVRYDINGVLQSPLDTCQSQAQTLDSRGTLDPFLDVRQYRYNPVDGFIEVNVTDSATQVLASGMTVSNAAYSSLPEVSDAVGVSGTYQLIAFGQ